MFLIEAEVNIHVQGISGPFTKNIGWLVRNAHNLPEAKQKFEAKVREDHAHMNPIKISYEYKKLIGEIV